jgi:hypothetical protein
MRIHESTGVGQTFATKVLMFYIQSDYYVQILQVCDLLSDAVNSQPWKLPVYISYAGRLLLFLLPVFVSGIGEVFANF